MLRKKNWLQYVTVSASQIQPNGIKCRSTMLYFGMKQSLYGLSSHWSHLCDGSIPPCSALEQEQHHPSPDGKILGETNNEWMKCPKLMAKQPLASFGLKMPAVQKLMKTIYSKVLQYTVKSWHWHEPREKYLLVSEQNVAYSRRDRLQTFCPTELFGHLRWRRTDPEFLLRRRASQVLRSAQMTSKFGMESGWVEHKMIKYQKLSKTIVKSQDDTL